MNKYERKKRPFVMAWDEDLRIFSRIEMKLAKLLIRIRSLQIQFDLIEKIVTKLQRIT